jgi:hypothetical protein
VIHKIHKVSFCVVLLHRLKEHSANVHRGAYALAERATEASQNLRILQDTHIFHHKKKNHAIQQTWQPLGFQWTIEIKLIELIELIGLYANMQLDAH